MLTTFAHSFVRRLSGALAAPALVALLALALPWTGLAQDRPESYVIERGDTLSAIARRFGCSLAELREANGIDDVHSIRAGDRLSVPECEGSSAPTGDDDSDGASDGDENRYRIRAGDYLEHIAENHGCSVAELMEANNLDSDVIYAGQYLVIPACTRTDSNAGPDDDDNTYQIQPGDYLGAIAHRFGCSIDELRMVNGISGDLIRAGDRLTIPECTGVARRRISREIDTTTLPRLMQARGFDPPRRFRGLVVAFMFDRSREHIVGERWFGYEESADEDAWNPASSIKLYAAVAALQRARGLGFTPDARVTFHGREEEHSFSLRELVTEALGPSNNIAYNFLVQLVGYDRLNGQFFSSGNGFSNTAIRRAYAASAWMEMGESSSFRDTPEITISEGGRTRTLDSERGSVETPCGGAACTTLRDLAECMRRLMLQEQLPASETYQLTREDLLAIRLALRSDRARGEEVVEGLASVIDDEDIYFYHKAGYAGRWYSDNVYIYDPGSRYAWIVSLAGYPGRDTLDDAARIIAEIIAAGDLNE